MKRFKILITILTLGTLMFACTEDFLEYKPKGTVSGDQLNTPERVDKMCIAAYSALGNDHWTVPYTSLWPYGSVRSDNSYKGGGGTADVPGFNKLEQFAFITTDMSDGDLLWHRLFIGVSRANKALKRLEELSEDEFAKKTTRMAEMRFLRGHFNFLLKINFKHIPYIHEDIPADSLKNISNRKYSSQELWDKIAADFEYAQNNLPADQEDVGRADKFKAKAYLAKTLLYQAYEQDKEYNVVNIDQQKLERVVSLVNDVIGSGKYDLFDDYAKNFLWQYENGPESVFAIQNSIDDGTESGRLDMGNGLNHNMASEYGCCWFHIPSQNLVNAYETSADGLPLFDTFNQSDMKDSAQFQDNTVDPRLDHTVGIPGHPFKYKPDFVYQTGWARTPNIYGYYSTMKEIQQPDCPCFKKVGPFYASSKNTIVIRYADVLLWKAEALIELGREDEALPIINRIRGRAQQSTGRLERSNGDPISNYSMQTYKPGENCTWTQDFARKALRWERRLEFAMEGWRFYDLVRWGIAAETINSYFEEEKTKREYLKEAHFTENRDEYLPIPQQQIDFSEGTYKQNPGW